MIKKPPFFEQFCTAAGNRPVKPAGDRADEAGVSVTFQGARGGASTKPIGALGAQEDDKEQEDEKRQPA